MRLSTPNNVLIGFTAAGTLLVGMMIVIIVLLYRSAEDQRWIEHTHVVIDSVERINSALQQAESAQRAYFISEEPSYFAVRDDAMSRVESLLLDIRELTADNPSQQHRLAELAALAQLRLEHMNDLSDGAPEPGAAVSRRSVAQGAQETAQILVVVAEMEREERNLLDRRSTVAGTEATVVLSGLSTVTVAFLVFLGFLFRRIRHDTGARERLEEELRRMAMTDALTGLHNRRSFMALGAQAVASASRYQQPLVCLMLDADSFKKINDSHGHDTGDVVLRTLAASLRGQLRDVDIVGRIGGEEFAVLLPQTTLEHSVRVAERLRRALAAATVVLDDKRLSFTVCIGVAELGAGMNLEEILAAADRGLYDAKRAGRDRVAVAA